jgi:hypothetical protein
MQVVGNIPQHIVPLGLADIFLRGTLSILVGLTDIFMRGSPYHPPANGSVLSCQQCATRLKPVIRYINGSNDGIQAAVSNVQDGKPFNPACDPSHSHTSDGLHTTVYCNGWTNGYISAWNAKHSIIPSIPNLVACKKEFSDSLVCTTYAYTYTNGTHSKRSTK